MGYFCLSSMASGGLCRCACACDYDPAWFEKVKRSMWIVWYCAVSFLLFNLIVLERVSGCYSFDLIQGACNLFASSLD